MIRCSTLRHRLATEEGETSPIGGTLSDGLSIGPTQETHHPDLGPSGQCMGPPLVDMLDLDDLTLAELDGYDLPLEQLLNGDCTTDGTLTSTMAAFDSEAQACDRLKDDSICPPPPSGADASRDESMSRKPKSKSMGSKLRRCEGLIIHHALIIYTCN